MFASGAGARDTSATGSIFSSAGLGAISGVASGMGTLESGSATGWGAGPGWPRAIGPPRAIGSTGTACFEIGFFSGDLAVFFATAATFGDDNSLAAAGSGATIRAALALDGAARVALSVRADGTPSD